MSKCVPNGGFLMAPMSGQSRLPKSLIGQERHSLVTFNSCIVDRGGPFVRHRSEEASLPAPFTGVVTTLRLPPCTRHEERRVVDGHQPCSCFRIVALAWVIFLQKRRAKQG